ncbi:uncharacterized protein G2W53_014012 [Senna tora]|uniref:Uncharacterized protein n=1 Tax=Senna tora TaxID=362788 RepID=A0A834WSV7_9FABA|nr:uncharacterized protein G2W53_014012 [Senna tora]
MWRKEGECWMEGGDKKEKRERENEEDETEGVRGPLGRDYPMMTANQSFSI